MRFRLYILLLAISAVALRVNCQDGDFSEFEDFDDEMAQLVTPDEDRATTETSFEDENVVEDDDSETKDFDHFQDSEEFEGQDEKSGESMEQKPYSAGGEATNDLKITHVPLHLNRSWQNYYLEIALMGIIFIYAFNYVTGRSKNESIANSWLEHNRSILESNFALVGDGGSKNSSSTYELRKESEDCYTIWCSGRQFIEGMLVEMRLIKRQCLIGALAHIVKPNADQLAFKVGLEYLDPFVFCLASKKNGAKVIKEFVDVTTFCNDRRQLPDKANREFGDLFVVHSESAELLPVFLQDPRIYSLLCQYKDLVDLLHVSDQYQSMKYNGDEAPKKRDTEAVLVLKFMLPGKGYAVEDHMESLVDLTRLCIYIAEKMSRFRLSKEARAKGEKNRQKVEESFLKQTHQQRQEQAQIRRGERIRHERERIMAEDDPEKQRRLELKEQKRLAKKNTPKLKQMKVRTM